jgi:hypothetical protein
MPYVQFSEQQILNAMFGNVLGKVKTTIAAAATAQTSVTAGTFASGGATTTWDNATPAATTNFITATPGTSNTINQYTAPHMFAATAVTASPAAFTIASQSIGLAVTAGDVIFNCGITAGDLGAFMYNTIYIGLTTQAVSGSTQANVISGEPTIGTGSYARIALANNLLNWTSATAAQPSVLANAGTNWAFAQSSAAWSTAGTNLIQAFICDSPTGTTVGTNVNVLASGALGVAQAVNAASITLSFAAAAFTITLT